MDRRYQLHHGSLDRPDAGKQARMVQYERSVVVHAFWALFFVFVTAAQHVSAQGTIYPINGGSITACNGGLVTSNGLNGGGYENNEDHEMTICPDEPGQGIFLTFVSFDLSEDGAAPVDQFVIYDGPDATSPVIGTYTGGQLQGQIVATTPDNTSGCITLRFTSNEVGEGIFSAVFECGTPCWPPVPNAAIIGEQLPAKVCLDEVIGFDATQSQAHPGRTIVSYEWDMKDGTLMDGITVSHAFDEPGQYMVSLRVTDDVGCTNTQQTAVPVWVGTVPVFAGTTESANVCAGAEMVLEGEAEAVTWNELPSVDLGGQIDLPDQVGQLFTSELEFTVFPTNAVVMTPTDLASFCVSMEHSFIGDFILSLTCPNGQNVVMHQQGGGGTFVGDANEIGEGIGDLIVPGACWDYCFSASATWGTWEDCAEFGPTPNVMPSSQGQALIPGTYTPVDPFTDLIGCPLNGIWTLNFVDQWAADNGTMCNWSINFDPSLYPDLVEFTPILGTTPDSVFWSGPGVVQSGTDPSDASVLLDTPGTYPYLFTVVDDFGCTHDTTISIVVRPPPQVDASATSVGLCSLPPRLRAMIVANGLPPGSGPLQYSWAPAALTTNPNVAEPFTQITEPTMFFVTVQPNGQPWCTTTDSVLVMPPSFMENDSAITHALCQGEEGTVTISTVGPGGPWNYEWRDVLNSVVRDTEASDGDALTAGAGTYLVLVSESADGNGCLDTLEVIITEPELLVWTITPRDTTICYTGLHTLTAATTGGTLPVSLTWNEGLTGAAAHTVSPDTTTTYSVMAMDANGCTLAPMNAVVTVLEPLVLESLIDFDQCNNVPFTLAATNVNGGNGAYEYSWNNGAPPLPSMTDAVQVDTELCLTVSDGCETPPFVTCAFVTVLRTPPLVLTADSVYGCAPFQLRFALQDTTLGASIAWDFGDGTAFDGTDSINHIYADAGRYDVSTVVTWPNGCITDTTIQEMVRVIPVPVADFTWAPRPLTVLEPVARFVELAAPNEVSYAWDFFAFGTSDEIEPEVTFPNDIGRFYPVQLLVRNVLGCADSALINVHVEDEFMVYVPNTFTPNGDGLNDVFQVQGNDVSPDEYRLVIFDRWGKEVFLSTDREAVWHGAKGLGEGDALPEGVYTWRLNVRSLQTLQKRIITGHVTLLR